MDVCWSKEVMKELPDFTISIILSFLEARDISRCACIAKAWESCAQFEPFASKVSRAKVREQYLWNFYLIKNFMYRIISSSVLHMVPV